eukprot:COSAG06_NODE_1941_length_8015_cov_2.703007_10_plen_115_part_00
MQECDAPSSGDSEPDAAGGSALSDDSALAVAKAQEALSLLPKLLDDAQDGGGGVEAVEVRCTYCCHASRADLSSHWTVLHGVCGGLACWCSLCWCSLAVVAMVVLVVVLLSFVV